MALQKSHTIKRGGGFPDTSTSAYYMIGTYQHDRLNDGVQAVLLAWANKAARDDFKAKESALKEAAADLETAQIAHAAIEGQSPEDQARRSEAYVAVVQAHAAAQAAQSAAQSAGPEPTLQAQVQVSKVSRFADADGNIGTAQVYDAVKSLPEWADAVDA